MHCRPSRRRFKRPALSRYGLAGLALCALLGGGAHAQSKPSAPILGTSQDLIVDVRQVREDRAGGTGASIWSTVPSQAPALQAQQVRVRQGEKAALQWQTSQPMQWVQSLQSQNSALTAASASATSQGGGLTQALVWMESGQGWTVTPHWTGGRQPVRLDIEFKAKAVDERLGTELPSSQQQTLATTVSAPLGQWVTLAATGQAAQPGTYSSQPRPTTRTLMQVRVSLP